MVFVAIMRLLGQSPSLWAAFLPLAIGGHISSCAWCKFANANVHSNATSVLMQPITPFILQSNLCLRRWLSEWKCLLQAWQPEFIPEIDMVRRELTSVASTDRLWHMQYQYELLRDVGFFLFPVACVAWVKLAQILSHLTTLSVFKWSYE